MKRMRSDNAGAMLERSAISVETLWDHAPASDIMDGCFHGQQKNNQIVHGDFSHD